MQLPVPFMKFPFRFDVERMRAEVEALPKEHWREHLEGFAGNSALTLITTGGTDNDDVEPPMMPTQDLLNSPYLQQVLATFRTLHGRARLMRLAPNAGVPPHVDKKYYWRQRARVHIPITTHPDIKFHCGGDVVHMAPGEAWTFDNWRTHEVVNQTPTWRVHLAFDTIGSATFWNAARPPRDVQQPQFIPFNPAAPTSVLAYESHAGDAVMPPGEVDFEVSRLVADVRANPANDPAAVQRFMSLMGSLRREWLQLWLGRGTGPEALPLFEQLLMQMTQQCKTHIPDSVRLASNNMSVVIVLAADFQAMLKTPRIAALSGPQAKARTPSAVPVYDRPIFIVSAPRSGSTLLFETLSANEGFWTLGGEGHEHVERIASLHPKDRGHHSNRLTAEDVTPEIAAQLRTAYAESLRMADGSTSYASLGVTRPAAVRLLEKTPKNSLRIPFMRAVFPDAKFIFLHRKAEPNISAIMEAWRSGGFKTYAGLPDWQGLPWSLLLIPGWRDLKGADLAKIATRQWRDTNETIMSDLAAISRQDWCDVAYEDLLHDPGAELKKLCAFAGVPFNRAMETVADTPLRYSRYTLTAPDPEKWRKNEPAMAKYLPEALGTIERLASLTAKEPA